MKVKILLTSILLSTFFLVHAQKDLPRGSILLGGDISFNSGKYENFNSAAESKGHGFNISPSVAIAVKDNLFLGLSLGYSYSKNVTSATPTSYDSAILHGYTAAVYIRKYKPLKNNFNLFLQGSIYGSYSKRTIENVPNRTFYQKDISAGLSITPGISYAINSKLQIETGLNSIFGINYTRSEFLDNVYNSQKTTGSSFGVYTSLNNFSSQLYFGFRLLLQKKVKANNSVQG